MQKITVSSIAPSIAALVSALAFAASLSAAPSPAQVNELLAAYYRVQTRLATDDLTGAKSAAGELSGHASHVGAPSELVTAAASVAEAGGIKVARTRFQAVSTHLQALVESVGTNGGPVFVALCPMAFDRGGTWLQDNTTTIANPYFGTLMPRCGRVTKQLGGKLAADDGDAEPSSSAYSSERSRH